MAVQNLISAEITADTKTEILKALGDIRGKLDFLLTLQSHEVMGLFRAGKDFIPFIDECHKVATAHPEIVPGIFDKDEYQRDWRLSQDLGAIADALNQLAEGINHTLTAARSDALVASLDIYAAVKLNRDKVAGLNSVADKLAVYFKKTSKAVPRTKS
jgi:hypothetical protein